MPLDALSECDREILRRALAFQLKQWDWEWPIVLGFEASDLAAFLASWPPTDDGNQGSVSRAAIHACVGDLVGLRPISESNCMNHIGVTITELANVFSRWHGDFRPQSPLDFIPLTPSER